MNYFKSLILIILSSVVLALGAQPVREYDLGDWITIKNFNQITSLAESNTFIYFGTTGGIIPYHKHQHYEEAAYTTSDGLIDDKISAVYYDMSTQYIWAAHRGGVSYLTATGDWWENPYKQSAGQPPIVRIGALDNSIILKFADGRLLELNSQSGYEMGKFDRPADFHRIDWNVTASSEPVSSVSLYNVEGGYWLKEDGYIQDHELREFPWNLKYVTDMQQLFGGVYGLGYIVGDDHLKSFQIHPSGLLKNYVNAFDFDGNYLWAGSLDDRQNDRFTRTGISRYNYKTDEWQYFEDELIHELATASVTRIDAKNDIMVAGTRLGVSVYRGDKKQWRRFSTHDGLWSDVVTAVEVGDNKALVGTDFGLNLIDLSRWQMSKVSLTDGKGVVKVHQIKQSPNYFWIGTNNGIYSLKKSSQKLRHFDFNGKQLALDKAVAANCHAIAANDSDVVFYGDNFFLKYDLKRKNWKDLPGYQWDGLVNDLAISGEYLWIGTTKGAILLNMRTGGQEEYSAADGLAGNQVMKVIIDNDWVWFGTEKGLTKYNWRKYVLE